MTLRKFTAIAIALLGLGAAQAQVKKLADPPADVTAVTKNAKSSSGVTFGKDGLVFSNEKKSDQLKVHGYMQGDGRFFSSDLKGQSPERLLWRRIRPVFEGTLFNTLDFRFMPYFRHNNPQNQEVYVEVKSLSFAKPRIGKFKTPLGLEALRSDQDGTFVERSLASDLVPLREVGAQVGGSLFANAVSYAIGYFNGTTDGSNGNFEWRTSNEGAARIFLQPFISGPITALKGLGFGVAGSFANEHGALPSFKTIGQNSFFKYSKAFANGQHNRITPQAYYFAGPVGVLTEYTVSSQEVSSKNPVRRLANEAWQVAGSVVLTGDKNTYKGVQPKHAFEPNKCLRHLGAWEVAARYSRLRVDGDAFPLFADPTKSAQGAAEWAVGINFYPNRFVKIMNDYAHTRFNMATSSITPLHSENVIMSRIQLAF